MPILFFILFSVYQFIFRIFDLFYPQIVLFTIPFGLFISLLFAYADLAFFPISVIILFPQILTLMETHLSFLPISDRTIILYGACIGLGFSYLYLTKHINILKTKPRPILLFLSIGIGIIMGMGIVRVTVPMLSFYSLKNPLFLTSFPFLFALGEEFVFRGLYEETIWKYTRHWISIVGSALVAASFGVSFDSHLIAQIFVFHLILSTLYRITNSFWCSYACNVAAKLTIGIVLYLSVYPLVSPLP